MTCGASHEAADLLRHANESEFPLQTLSEVFVLRATSLNHTRAGLEFDEVRKSRQMGGLPTRHRPSIRSSRSGPMGINSQSFLNSSLGELRVQHRESSVSMCCGTQPGPRYPTELGCLLVRESWLAPVLHCLCRPVLPRHDLDANCYTGAPSGGGLGRGGLESVLCSGVCLVRRRRRRRRRPISNLMDHGTDPTLPS